MYLFELTKSATFLQERRPSGGTAATPTTEVSQAPVEIGRATETAGGGGGSNFTGAPGDTMCHLVGGNSNIFFF